MSRSTKGKKPPGWDYWGKRPLQGGAGGKPETKRVMKRSGIKRERLILKRQAQKEWDKDDE